MLKYANTRHTASVPTDGQTVTGIVIRQGFGKVLDPGQVRKETGPRSVSMSRDPVIRERSVEAVGRNPASTNRSRL